MPEGIPVLGWLCSGVCVLAWLVPLILLGREFDRRTNAADRSLLQQWARGLGWEILDCRRRWFGSPWMFSYNGAQRVYYLTVMYHEGEPRARRAWVRCGGWFFGPKTEKVELRWDGVSRPVPPPQPAPAPEPSRPRSDPLWDPWMDG